MPLNLLTVVLFLAPILVLSTVDPAFNDDLLGLIVFKAGLIDPEAKLTSWNEDDDSPCNWVGIKCDSRTSRVSELALDGFSLSGHIGRSLLRLQFLRILSLSKNNFTGPINPVLARFERLRVIDLSENGLSGLIPDDLFRQCRSLRAISLARNDLTGRIPASLSSCSTLEGVNFSSNRLSGPLPSGIWSLIGLRSLDLSENLLEGEIPRGIESVYALRAVNLRNNKFVGQLPVDIGGCLLLKSLDFSQNFFSGSLPESMRKLSLCTSLSLRGNSFAGEVPDWIGDMRSLESLDLSSNNFSGQIKNSFGNLHLLRELNLSANGFTGSLPPWIFELGLRTVSLSVNKLSGIIEYPSVRSMAASHRCLGVLDLSSNAFSGEILPAIGRFRSLKLLNMSRNSLSGYIPGTIGQLKTTQLLDLSFNKLNGSIPSKIGGAFLLQELRLENNFLTGKIPSQIANCSSLTSLILSKNNLTGPVPAAIANLTGLQIVDLSFNDLSGTLPKELTNLSHLIVFNISHNHLQGELPVGGFFNTIPPSSVSGNPSICGSVLNHSCPAVHPMPIVLNPNSSSGSNGSSLSTNIPHKRIVLSISTLVAIGAAVFIALGVVFVTVLNLHVRSAISRSAAAFRMSQADDFVHSPTTDSNHGKLVMFSDNAGFIDGAHALLTKDCELGRGGFGAVYQTVLQDGCSVAIKKLNVSSLIKSQEDFEREVKKLGKIKHCNLVQLKGYYWTPSLQILINEYVCSGSLYNHLHEGQSENFLSWQQRFTVILGTAKGLAHLHQGNVIHYNIKSANVLIDYSGEPKVGDFGLARLLPTLDRQTLSSKIQSALGYMAPEFACQTVKITEKCDVYGFGILILEVVTGRRPVEYMEDDVVVLCDMVRGALDEGRVEECVDGRLGGKFPADEVIPVVKLGLICASQVPSNRPDMGEVVRILELIRCPSEGSGWV